ncbi:MAG: hypothetical protein H6710_20480 [Myxococcales bacterium]|nr:hypothetical protein [Myxococcales bacterium]MCB9706321.1 hypothetical protein [Myxococcales bacterium]
MPDGSDRGEGCDDRGIVGRIVREIADALASAGVLALLVGASTSGCATPEPAPTSPSTASAGEASPAGERGAAAPATTKTANPDRRGFDNQPDYAAEAAALREYVDGRLPAATPTDPRRACEAMLATADAFYAAIETDARRREEVAAALRSSREDDLQSCVAETSPRAAACVSLLLTDRTAELPWLVDQCSRAYPR